MAERSGIKIKTFHERKNQNHPSPRRSPASRWSALRRWHTNQYSKKGDPHIRYRSPGSFLDEKMLQTRHDHEQMRERKCPDSQRRALEVGQRQREPTTRGRELVEWE